MKNIRKIFTITIIMSIFLFGITGIAMADSDLPERYNTADTITLNVRNQGVSNSCWAITSAELFEIAYAKQLNNNEIIQFSSRHIDYATSRYFLNNEINETGFNRTAGNGGNPTYAMAYFSSGKGPILETDMPFENNKNVINLNEIQGKTVQAQVEGFVQFPEITKTYYADNSVTYNYSAEKVNEIRNEIKKQIMNYGAVSAYTNRTTEDLYFSEPESSEYVYGNAYFCNEPNASMNHTVCIIGWDDTYSKDNFKNGCKPAIDGAYIAVNSWGTTWNSGKGFYYISYDDSLVEKGMYGIQRVSNVDYDKIYQYDELGYNFALHASDEGRPIYGANVFKRNSMAREKLTEIGLYFYSDTESIKVYLNNNGSDLNVSKLPVIVEASNLKTGYQVFKLNEPVLLGETFSIIVKYSDSNRAYIPIEAKKLEEENKFYYVSSNEGESFYSLDGENYSDLYHFKTSKAYTNMNACIKAFTTASYSETNNEEFIKNNNIKVLKDITPNAIYGISEETTIQNFVSNNFNSNYTIKIYDGENEVTTGNVGTGMTLKVYNGTEKIAEYKIIIYGDTTGDGKILSVDALSIVKNKLNTEKFKSAIHEEAGRVTASSRTQGKTPSSVDALAVIKHKLDLEKISQF